MSADDSKLAIAALVVALVALLTAASQVLSQLFATADGYRRCQAGIVGQWATLTSRKFRWRELRYETIYTTPRFSLAPYRGPQCWQRKPTSAIVSSIVHEGHPALPLDGTPEMIQETYATPISEKRGLEFYDGPSEMVSWVRLIDALHINAEETRRFIMSKTKSDFNTAQDWGGYTIPMIKKQKHSWDFVPPDVVRPLAVITLQDLAVFARRLGMNWKAFRPSEGVLHAEGDDFSIDFMIVRSVGLVAQINTPEPMVRYKSKESLYIPTEPVDKMGFGIVTGDRALHLSCYNIGTPEDCLARMKQIDIGAAEELRGLMEANGGWTPGISDIISLASPMLRLRGSTIIRVPKPALYEGGLTFQHEGFVVFHNRLREMIQEREEKLERVSEQSRWVLCQYEELEERYSSYWVEQETSQGNDTPLAFLEDLHDRHDATTQYFRDLQSNVDWKDKEFHERPRLRYLDLMNEHIAHAVGYFSEARQRIAEGRARDQYGLQVADWIIEGCHVYFDNIPKIAQGLERRRPADGTLVEDAWLTMMLRAFLWHRCHLMVDGNRIPSHHWGSRQPVYIG